MVSRSLHRRSSSILALRAIGDHLPDGFNGNVLEVRFVEQGLESETQFVIPVPYLVVPGIHNEGIDAQGKLLLRDWTLDAWL